MNGEQRERARVAAVLLDGLAGSAGAAVCITPADLSARAGLPERRAREAAARLFAAGLVSLERRGEGWIFGATSAGHGVLRSLAIGLAAELAGQVRDGG